MDKLVGGGFATTDLAAPASGATNQPTSVTLSWGTSSGAVSYAYCLDTTPGGSCSGTRQTAGTATSVTVSGLTAGAPLTTTSPAAGTTGLGSPVVLTWTSTLTNVAYTVCGDQTPDGTCSGVWWPNGQSTVKWLENPAPCTDDWPFDGIEP